MHENDIARVIVDCAFHLHKDLGPGLFESVYQTILAHELETNFELSVQCQPPIPVIWKGVKMDIGFKPDIIIGNKVIVEIKSIEKLMPVHFKQLTTYLRLTELKLGILINFNEELIKNGIKRVVNGLY